MSSSFYTARFGARLRFGRGGLVIGGESKTHGLAASRRQRIWYDFAIHRGPGATSMGLISSQQLGQYRDLGILFPIQVLTEGEARRYRTAFDKVTALFEERPKPVQLTQFHAHFRWAFELASSRTVLDAVEEVLGPDLLIWSSSFFPKAPGDPSYVSWHQDGTYWGLDSTAVVTAWIALTDSSPDNGCMRVAPGTHKQAILPHVETYAGDNLLSRGQEVAAEVPEEDALDVILAPGEMSLHHVNIIHGSNANHSNRWRIGFAIRFTTPEVRPDESARQAVLARGNMTTNNFELLPPPKERPAREALALQRAHAEGLYQALQQTKGRFVDEGQRM